MRSVTHSMGLEGSLGETNTRLFSGLEYGPKIAESSESGKSDLASPIARRNAAVHRVWQRQPGDQCTRGCNPA